VAALVPVQCAVLGTLAAVGDHLTFHATDVARLQALGVPALLLAVRATGGGVAPQRAPEGRGADGPCHCDIRQALDSNGRLAPTVVLAAARALVRTLVRSARLSLALLDDLAALDGTPPHARTHTHRDSRERERESESERGLVALGTEKGVDNIWARIERRLL
jgi:hypothetical protein